jgi:trans-L-3-hydroxyproline dehydratase
MNPTEREGWRRPSDWRPPWPVITTVDAHAAGEPLRVVTGGLAAIPGDTMLARRRFAREHLDGLRRVLMWEPRGHADMYGAFLTPPITPGADLGVLFLHNEGFSTMCGHGVIALVTILLETGMLHRHGEPAIVTLDTPAGLVRARARRAGGRVESVAFENVPSFVLARDRLIQVPEVGQVRCDVVFGGAFYAVCDAGTLGLSLGPSEFRRLIDVGMRIKRAVVEAIAIEHPGEPDLSFLYGTILVGPPHGVDAHSRNACVFADGEVDRSPTGTGVSGRAALLHARGEIGLDEPFTVESLIGTRFTGRALRTATVGPHAAVVPEVEGSAHLTGRHEFFVDPADPLRDAFILR